MKGPSPQRKHFLYLSRSVGVLFPLTTLFAPHSVERRYKRSEGRYVLPELRRSTVELECDANEGLKFDDDDDDEEVRGIR